MFCSTVAGNNKVHPPPIYLYMPDSKFVNFNLSWLLKVEGTRRYAYSVTSQTIPSIIASCGYLVGWYTWLVCWIFVSLPAKKYSSKRDLSPFHIIFLLKQWFSNCPRMDTACYFVPIFPCGVSNIVPYSVSLFSSWQYERRGSLK